VAVLAKRHWLPNGWRRPWPLYKYHRLVAPAGSCSRDTIVLAIDYHHDTPAGQKELQRVVVHQRSPHKQSSAARCKLLVLDFSMLPTGRADGWVVTKVYNDKNEDQNVLRLRHAEQRLTAYVASFYFDQHFLHRDGSTATVEITAREGRLLPLDGIIGYLDRDEGLSREEARMYCQRVKVKIEASPFIRLSGNKWSILFK
jgi:hypothetical protein